MTDRGTDTSGELTIIRSVRSTAESALQSLICYRRYRGQDPDLEDMIEALDKAVASLDRWKRTGRKKRI